MKSVQEVFDQLQTIKQEQKSIRQLFKNSLAQNGAYQQILEELQDLKKKKKEIEVMTQAELGSRYEKWEELSVRVKNNKQLLTDIAITNLSEGKPIEVKDAYESLYEPKFSVAFRKTSAKGIPQS